MIKKTYYIFADDDDGDEVAILVFYGDVTKIDIQHKVYRFIGEWRQMKNEGGCQASLEEYVINKLSDCYTFDLVTDFDTIWFHD